MRRLATARSPVARQGFSLVELVVAIVLLAIGLGALAGTGAWIARGSAVSARTERAATIARSRLELLRLTPCTPGSAVIDHGDLIEQWALSVAADRATVAISVTPADGGRMHHLQYRSAFAC